MWIQRAAELWLVLSLTGDPVAVGIVTALGFGPVLFLGPWAGLIADRSDRRRLLFVTQGLRAIPPLALGLLVVMDQASLGAIYALTLASGIATAFDNPTRRSFLQEMVGRDRATNAVGLNASVMTSARVVGPLIAGVVITSVGIGWCFIINGLTYLALILALVRMRPDELYRRPLVERAPGQVREGFRYAASNAAVRWSLLLLLVVGTLSWSSVEVMIPLIVRLVLDGEVTSYTVVFALFGAGAVLGSLIVASRSQVTLKQVAIALAGLGLALVASAASPNLWWAVIAFGGVGLAGAAFVTAQNAQVIHMTTDRFQGRILALVSSIQLGARSIGALAIGGMAAVAGPRVAVAVGGVISLIGAAVAFAGPSQPLEN
jgi:MFS family permease